MIGTSAGGVTTVQALLRELHGKLSLPLLIVQHLPADARVNPALIFGSFTHATVLEAYDKVAVELNHVYFAPPSYHLLIERDFTLSLTQDEPVHFSRPSIDVLFESAARAYGSELCGVLLTGANQDGAAGLKAISDLGGYTMVQDPRDAEVGTMPQAALSLFTPNFTGTVKELSRQLLNVANGGAV